MNRSMSDGHSSLNSRSMIRVLNIRAPRLLAATLGLILCAAPARGFDYHVGPEQRYTAIGAVPWYKLAPGDNVFIHYRQTPYFEKFLISTRGTAAKWIRVLG